MKSIQDHNRDRIAFYNQNFIEHTNVECPICKNEMVYADDAICCSNPPKRKVKCNCGYIDYILV